MARSNLTSEKRGFKKNEKSFVPDTFGAPLEITLDDGTTTTTVVVNPRSLTVTGPNGEAVEGSVRRTNTPIP